jgi:DNA (cytosine-5)-methyltransferase 1
MVENEKLPTAVDLFCGCGGVTLALKRQNFNVVAAVDNDSSACITYRKNHNDVMLYENDIMLLNPETIRHNDLKGENLDLLVVCAPCQPFSNQNRHKYSEDSRMRLILESIRFAKSLKPSLIFFENVAGLSNKKNDGILQELTEGLETAGFKLGQPTRINAADYGVPQRRIRCIMLAASSFYPPKLPQPIPVDKRNTVRAAIAHLRRLESGQKDPLDPLHFARNHQPIALERLKHIPKNGGSRFSLPEHLALKCHKGHSGHPDVYGRMSWDTVAPTLTSGCTDITRGRFAHPEDDRAITLREAALLQTFPSDYEFVGSLSQIASQIGNAVPVRLAEALAPILRRSIMNQRVN